MTDMTIAEVVAELKSLEKEFGNAPYSSISVRATRNFIMDACFYPNGITKSPSSHSSGNTFRETLADLRTEVAKQSALDERNTIRDMAIAIMRAHAEQGECRHAHLRSANFSDSVIAKYGERACAEAERVAGSGPFVIAPETNIANAAE